MSHTQVQLSRGNTIQIASYTGPQGELTINTDDSSLVVQDGATAGGKTRFTPGIRPPQGRLTLTSGTPILAGNVAAAGTVYYTPYIGQWCPIYNGTVWQQVSFAETNLALDSNAADTGYQASGNLYDIFAVLNGGVFTIGTGPAWSSTTARGTGAGTTQLQMFNGIWTNANVIALRYGNSTGNTISVAANQASYLGTIYMTAPGQTTMNVANVLGAGGGAGVLGMWNAYNRVKMHSGSSDNTASWTNASATWAMADAGAAGAGANNRITWVDGLQQSAYDARYFVFASAPAGVSGQIGVNVSVTTGAPGSSAQVTNGGASLTMFGPTGAPRLGLSYIQAMEASSGGTTTFTGGSGPALQGLRMQIEM